MRFLEKVPLRYRIIVEVLLIVILVALFYYFMYQPRVEKITQLKQQYDSLSLKVSRLKPIALSYDQFKKEVELLNKQFNMVLEVLPNERSYNELYDQIVGLAEKNGVMVLLFQPTGQNRIDNFHSSVNFNMNVEAGYVELISFLYRINYLDKIINLRNLQIKGIKDKEGEIVLNVNLGLNSYMFNVPKGN